MPVKWRESSLSGKRFKILSCIQKERSLPLGRMCQNKGPVCRKRDRNLALGRSLAEIAMHAHGCSPKGEKGEEACTTNRWKRVRRPRSGRSKPQEERVSNLKGQRPLTRSLWAV
ncbi:hypothetical protein K0M31_019318 [Melipona bicolor]|uniref:Uncharacterized protein n=1 Tax=Melipona bicolor TaxID=60889 RepID=A0AA40G277_9HYME|nr:hypothetical protein K0M31_019318 [Melipona bicolor]